MIGPDKEEEIHGCLRYATNRRHHVTTIKIKHRKKQVETRNKNKTIDNTTRKEEDSTMYDAV